MIDCYLDERGGAMNIEQWLEPCEVLRPTREPLPEALDADGVIITGSAASVLEPPAWVAPLEERVARAANRGSAVLGLCFGHQILARAVFGDTAVRRAPQPEFGWAPMTHSGGDPLFDGVPSQFRCFVSHSDEVDPACEPFRRGAELLAKSSLCPVAAFRVRNRPLWGLQFHAEMGLPESRELVLSRARAAAIDPEPILRDTSVTAQLAERLFANFSRQVEALA